MKLRHPAAIKCASFVGAWLVRLWVGSVRYRYEPRFESLSPHDQNHEARYIYAIWHENLLLPSYQYGGADVSILISQHADGQLIAEVCQRLGSRAIRGSTTRGGVEALRKLLRAGQTGHLAITPDGPRGPRRQVQPGVVYLAARTGMPVVPVGFGYRRAWRFRSWDRFVLPKPGSRAVGITGKPIPVPPDLDREQLEHYRQRIEQELAELTAAAERRAAGQPDGSLAEPGKSGADKSLSPASGERRFSGS